jgi:hypothetical protein
VQLVQTAQLLLLLVVLARVGVASRAVGASQPCLLPWLCLVRLRQLLLHLV